MAPLHTQDKNACRLCRSASLSSCLKNLNTTARAAEDAAEAFPKLLGWCAGIRGRQLAQRSPC